MFFLNLQIGDWIEFVFPFEFSALLLYVFIGWLKLFRKSAYVNEIWKAAKRTLLVEKGI
jgi:hypothetical protein